VRHEAGPVRTGHHRVGEDVALIEERLAHRNACGGDGRVTLAVRRMYWRTFGENLWQQITTLLLKDEVPRGGFEQLVRVDGMVGSEADDPVHRASVGFGARPTMHEPFLIPHRFGGARRRLCDNGQTMRKAKRAKSCLVR